jgi:hypothetical protein
MIHSDGEVAMAWGRDAREEMGSTAASRAEARRQENAVADAETEYMAAVDARVAEFGQRLAEIEGRLAAFDELARATSEFGTACETKLRALEALIERFDHTLAAMRDVHKQEVASLQERFTNVERSHASTDALATRKLGEASRSAADLRARLAGVEAAGAREAAYYGRVVSDLQRRIDALTGERQRAADRDQLANANETVVVELQSIRRDLAERSLG